MPIAKKKIPSPKGHLAAVIHFPETETRNLAILRPGFLDTLAYPA